MPYYYNTIDIKNQVLFIKNLQFFKNISIVNLKSEIF